MASEAEYRREIWQIVSDSPQPSGGLDDLAGRLRLGRGEAIRLIEQMISDGQLRREVDRLVPGEQPPDA